MFKKTLLFLTALPLLAQANVVITGTRVIYPADQKSINIQLSNVGDSPALVQAWLDKDNIKSNPNTESVPFVIAPPVTRVEAHSGQTLRVSFTGTENLPQDRESIFYFNLLDIPPKPSAESLQANPNYLQLAIRSRLRQALMSITKALITSLIPVLKQEINPSTLIVWSLLIHNIFSLLKA